MSDTLSPIDEDMDYVKSPSSPSLYEYICPCFVSQNHKFIQNDIYYEKLLSTDPDNDYMYKSKVYQPGERSVLDNFNGVNEDKNVKFNDNKNNLKVNSQKITQTLKRALDRERSKNQSSLVPKGLVRTSSDNDYDNNVNVKNRLDNDNNTNLEFDCQCVRWAIRQNNLSNKNNQQVNTNNDDDINNNYENNSVINSDDKDIEYEIIIIVDGIKTYDVIDSTDINGFGSSNQSLRKRWCVWKTAEEIFSLHASIFSILGDLSPKSPKLLSTNNSTETINVTSNMRTIITYFNGLLRNRVYISFPQLIFTFLDAPIPVKTAIGFVLCDENFINPNFNAPKIADNVSISNGSNDTLQDNNNTDCFRTMEVVELNINNHDKFRKLFMNMRVKIKPSELAVRLRLFYGVVNGGSICQWLIRTNNSTQLHSHQHAKDKNEACLIGQELLNCGLISTVSAGYYPMTSNLTVLERSEIYNSRVNKFSDEAGYTYKFPEKITTTGKPGSFTILGTFLSIKIPIWYHNRESNSTDANSENMYNNTISVDSSNSNTSGLSSPSESGKSYVEYLIKITHGDDEWEVRQRFSSFENYHKLLIKEGVKPNVSFPAKSYSKLVTGIVSDNNLDKRKESLEEYLVGSIEAIVQQFPDTSHAVYDILTRFLDPIHDSLIIKCEQRESIELLSSNQ